MGGRISDEDIVRVRDAANIVEVIGSYVPLKRSGRSFMGLCPFHGDSAPSFHVYPENQFFKCYGCQKKGSVFSFLMDMEKMEFPEAVTSLAERYGITITLQDGPSDRDKDERDRIAAALRAASFHFRANLKSAAGAAAAKYVEGRGIDQTMVDRFLVGYALNDWNGLGRALEGEFKPSDLEAAGLQAKSESGRHYDRFRHRVVFPISDLRGRIVGFGGRCMPDADPETPKYINSPETRVYQKNRVLYGLNLAREEDLQKTGIVVVEGYTDVVLLHRAGVRSAVATCGTALTPEHVRLMRMYTSTVYLVFDGDAAGVRAMDRGLDLLAGEDMDLRIAVLPGGADPAEFVAARGGDAFREEISKGRDILEFKLATARSNHDTDNPTGLARAADEMLSLVRKVNHPIKREEFMRRAAEGLGTPEAALRARMAQIPGQAQRTSRPPGGDQPGGLPLSKFEGMVIEALISDNSLIPGAMDDMPPDSFTDPDCRAAAQRLYGLFEQAGRIVRPEVLGDSPSGILNQVCDRLLEMENTGSCPDFGRVYSEALDSIQRLALKTKRDDLKSRLRKAVAAGDHEVKKQLLAALHETSLPADQAK